jgi:hypothetical protein
VADAIRVLEAEVDEARFVGMQRQPIPGKSLAEDRTPGGPAVPGSGRT